MILSPVPLYDLLSAGIKSVPSLSAIKYTNEDIVEMNYIHFNFKGQITVFPGLEEVRIDSNFDTLPSILIHWLQF